MPSRREQLADAVTDWVLDHGVSELSLRPLARDLGVSTYALVYWFGTKDEVLAVALNRVEERVTSLLAGWAEELGAVALGDLVRRYWEWSTSSEGARYTYLVIEGIGLGQRSESVRRYVERAVASMRALVQTAFAAAGLPPEEAVDQATLLFASLSGLQVDFAISGDVQRISPAAALLAKRLDELGNVPLDAVPDPRTGSVPR